MKLGKSVQIFLHMNIDLSGKVHARLGLFCLPFRKILEFGAYFTHEQFISRGISWSTL